MAPEIAEGAGELDGCPPATLADEACRECGLVQWHRPIRAPGRVTRRSTLEERGCVPLRQLGGKTVDEGDEPLAVVIADLRPQSRDSLLPLRTPVGHAPTLTPQADRN